MVSSKMTLIISGELLTMEHMNSGYMIHTGNLTVERCNPNLFIENVASNRDIFVFVQIETFS